MLQEIITYFICLTAFLYAGYGLVKLFFRNGKGMQDKEKARSMCTSCKAACTLQDLAQENHGECLLTGKTGYWPSQD